MSQRQVTWLTVLAVVAAACAPGVNEAVNVVAPASGTVAGFWHGVWHGLIVPITFVISLFSDHVQIYEVHNNGGWYNLGFLFGVSGVFGGGGHGSGRVVSVTRTRSIG